MTEPGRPVGFGAALVEQLRWFWQRLWLWIVIVTVLTAGAAAWIISSIDPEEAAFAAMLVGNAFHPLLVLIALSWALSAWRDDPPKDRQYFWLHPAERTAHTVARSLAGFIWLMLVVAVVIAATVVATQLFLGGAPGIDTARLWLYAAGAIALAYIAGSIAPVLSDRPGLWIVAVIAVVVIAGAIAEIRDIQWLQRAVEVFTGGPTSFGTALGAPGYEAARAISAATPGFELPNAERIAEARPAVALAVWLPISLAAYLAAARASLPR